MRRFALPTLLALVLGCVLAGSGPLFRGRSEYSEVFVFDEGEGLRSLRFAPDGAVQSRVKRGDPLALQLPYTQAAMTSLGLVAEPRQVLIVGLGGGAMPMFLRRLYPRARIDVVDIDPVVVKAARRYFGYDEDERLRTFVLDGRRFVEQSAARYDLIFLDAYGDSSVPAHLTTAEFLRSVRARLAPGGLAIGNVWSDAYNPSYGAMRDTWRAAFAELCVLDVAGSGNRIFLGFSEPRAVTWDAAIERLDALERAHRLPFDLRAHALPGCLDEPQGAQVLTDAPP